MSRVPSIVEIFEAQAARTPEAIAVEAGELRWSYQELDRRANWLGHALLRRGVGPEVVVGLAVEPSPELVLGLLGIWKAGGACLPIDPRWPKPRVDFLRRDGTTSLFLDGSFGFRDGMRADRPARAPRREELACLIYSEAVPPAGVEIEHHGLTHLHQAQRVVLGLSAGDRVLSAAPPGHHAAIAEVVLSLGAGATLCLASRDELAPPSLCAAIERLRISCVTLPPAWLAAPPDRALPALRHLLVGDPIPPALDDGWLAGRTVRHLYGPSAAGGWVTSADGARPSFGFAIPGAIVQILDRDLNPVPDGSEGELCIGGTGLARGYHNDRAQTAQRFVSLPAGRLFRTGDRARRLPDGSLEWRGRIDQPPAP